MVLGKEVCACGSGGAVLVGTLAITTRRQTPWPAVGEHALGMHGLTFDEARPMEGCAAWPMSEWTG